MLFNYATDTDYANFQQIISLDICEKTLKLWVYFTEVYHDIIYGIYNA